MADRPPASRRLQTPGAVLTRTDLRDLGWERRGIDAIFRECPVIEVPGYSRPVIRVEAYLALLEGSTYCDRCADRVRPCGTIPPALQTERPNGAARTTPPGLDQDLTRRSRS